MHWHSFEVKISARLTSLSYIYGMRKSTLHQKIIQTAGNLFYINGYNATGVNEIISKCGIAKATLYSHFKSKEDICISYLTQRHENFMESLQGYVSRRKKGKNQLLAIFDYLTDLYRESDFYGCWALRVLGELSPSQNRILATVQKQKKELLIYLAEVVSDNIINGSKAEIEKISGGIYLLYDSAITESHLFNNDWPIYTAKNLAPKLFEGSQLSNS